MPPMIPPPPPALQTTKPPLPKTPPLPATPAPAAQPRKTFSVKDWTAAGRGKRICVYGKSGMGKTNLCAQLEKSVFIGAENGGQEIRNPKTGAVLKSIPEIQTFSDLRSALQQPSLFDGYDTIVTDTLTVVNRWAVDHVLETIPAGSSKPGQPAGKAKNLESYGYGKGYVHVFDQMNLLIGDYENLVARGKNVVMVCQLAPAKVSNTSGEDFIEDAPELHHRNPSVMTMVVAWCDHVFRIAYQNLAVDERKAAGSTVRAIYTHPEVYFEAKSRTIPAEYAVVKFENPADDSIWRLVFNEAWKQ